MDFKDFKDAKEIELTPLSLSFSENETENALKKLFDDVFKKKLSDLVFDANVLGAAQLGTLDLVRKAINNDGLVLIEEDRKEEATRYIYKSWKSKDCQGRGLHFLEMFLQQHFPNNWAVDQMMQHKSFPYPTALSPASTNIHDDNKYLTSRLLIGIKTDAIGIQILSSIVPIIKDIIPARFLPKIAIVDLIESRLKRVDILDGISIFESSDTTLKSICTLQNANVFSAYQVLSASSKSNTANHQLKIGHMLLPSQVLSAHGTINN